MLFVCELTFSLAAANDTRSLWRCSADDSVSLLLKRLLCVGNVCGRHLFLLFLFKVHSSCERLIVLISLTQRVYKPGRKVNHLVLSEGLSLHLGELGGSVDFNRGDVQDSNALLLRKALGLELLLKDFVGLGDEVWQLDLYIRPVNLKLFATVPLSLDVCLWHVFRSDHLLNLSVLKDLKLF